MTKIGDRRGEKVTRVGRLNSNKTVNNNIKS